MHSTHVGETHMQQETQGRGGRGGGEAQEEEEEGAREEVKDV